LGVVGVHINASEVENPPSAPPLYSPEIPITFPEELMEVASAPKSAGLVLERLPKSVSVQLT
jgi:hypothetical protein